MEQFLNFFISNAYADSASAPASQGGFSFMFIFALIFVFMYFVMWRPQNKRAKEMRDLLSSLAKGDEVMTDGGLLGKITKLTEQYVTLAVTDNVELFVRRSAISSVLPKGTIKSL